MIKFDAKYAPEVDTAKNMRAQFESLSQSNKISLDKNK